MIRRNWLDLSRKLVDRFDLDFTINAIQEALGEAALSYWGEGVLPTRFYPSPFPIIMSSISLGGTVGNGIGYDPNGQITRNDGGVSPFTITASDPTNPRWDLLVIRYKAVGDTPVPKPSDPITTIDLNIHDDFELAVIAGTPSVTPSYPSKGPVDIILAGLRVPATATFGTQVTVDQTIREMAQASIVSAPVFVQERPSGVVNGTNPAFTLSKTPQTAASVLVMVDDIVLTSSEFTVTGTQVSIVDPPQPGQNVYAYYIANSGNSQNPIAGTQEIPSGVADGVNTDFVLGGFPQDQQSTLVMVDGIIVETSQWELIQSPSTATIRFLPGSVPALGQDVYAFYLVNAASFGGQPRTQTPETLYFTLSPTDISNKFVTLLHTPSAPTSVLCDVIGNTGQVYGTDFTVTGMQLSWSTLGMQSILAAGDTLRVSYLY